MGAYKRVEERSDRLNGDHGAELRSHNINVNCVLPDHHRYAGEPRGDARRRSAAAGVAPQDLAQVIVFLASDAARAIHGAALAGDGVELGLWSR